MGTLKFKTNLKCSGCVAAVQNNLDSIAKDKWEVDLASPEKILSIDDSVSKEEVEKAFEKAGYKAEEK